MSVTSYWKVLLEVKSFQHSLYKNVVSSFLELVTSSSTSSVMKPDIHLQLCSKSSPVMEKKVRLCWFCCVSSFCWGCSQDKLSQCRLIKTWFVPLSVYQGKTQWRSVQQSSQFPVFWQLICEVHRGDATKSSSITYFTIMNHRTTFIKDICRGLSEDTD